MSPLITAQATPLVDDAALARFADTGYLVLPGFLPDDLVDRLKPEVDHWVDSGLRARSIASCVDPVRNGVPPVLELELPAHGELVAHPPLMDLLHELMDGPFAYHHLHSDRQAADLPGKPWHHDYEEYQPGPRTRMMVHTLHYLDGLDPDTAGLAVLPGSHRRVATKSALHHRGTEVLPGEMYLDDLPRGSTVVLHSALFHARRARPDGLGKPRYFVDTSYCEAGVRWPPVKPYWRHMLRRGRELGLDRGWWPELFSEDHFAEYR